MDICLISNYFYILLLSVVWKQSSSISDYNITSNLNVVFIVIDDLRHLQAEYEHYPNFQKMAETGINFKYAFSQQALCAPSRNSILTGRRPDALRLFDFYSYWRDVVGNFTTLPQFFKENDYNTYSLGKIFHPGVSSNYTDDYPYSWSQHPYHPPTEIYKDAAVCKDENSNTSHRNLLCPVKVNDQPGKSLPDLESLEYAIEILKKNMSKPFFLAVGFHKPHIPLKFPKQYLDKIPRNKVQPPKFPYIPKHMPLVAWHPWKDVRKRDDIKNLNITFPMGTMPLEWTVKIKQSYYAASAYIDDLIGNLTTFINKSNTIVVLTSDHGWSLGENGMWAKYSNFDVALRVPLIFNIPGMSPKSVDTPVELVDIFPTLAELTGLGQKIPKCRNNEDKSMLCFSGKSLRSLMYKQKHPEKLKKFALSQYPRPSVYPQSNSDEPRLKDIKIMGYSIRTKRYRYTEWISFNNTSFTRNWNKIYGIELYDHVFDPEESDNVYMNPIYKPVKTKLSRLLKKEVEPI